MKAATARALKLGGLLVAGTALVAEGTRFSDYSPLTCLSWTDPY